MNFIPVNDIFIYISLKKEEIFYLKMNNIKNYLSFLFNRSKLYGLYIKNESNSKHESIVFEEKFKNYQRKDKFAPSEGAFQSPILEKTGNQYQKGLN